MNKIIQGMADIKEAKILTATSSDRSAKTTINMEKRSKTPAIM